MSKLLSSLLPAAFTAFTVFAALLLAGCGGAPSSWHLVSIRHIMPDLRFDAQRADGGDVTARDFRGRIVLLYFGYTHCPDVCQTTLALLAAALRELGPQADDVRVLYVSVDPARDTPPVLTHYVQQFDSTHIVGLVPDQRELVAFAKRYRIGYTPQTPDAAGNYEVSHSSAIFVFDRQGRARLLGTDHQPLPYFVDDLRRLLAEPET